MGHQNINRTVIIGKTEFKPIYYQIYEYRLFISTMEFNLTAVTCRDKRSLLLSLCRKRLCKAMMNWDIKILIEPLLSAKLNLNLFIIRFTNTNMVGNIYFPLWNGDMKAKNINQTVVIGKTESKPIYYHIYKYQPLI